MSVPPSVSAKAASEQTKTSYKTALKAFDTIRHSILERYAEPRSATIRGEIEADEAYFGGKRKGFLKIHVGVNIDTKQILTVKITDEHSHDSKHLKGIVKESAKHGKLIKVLGDGAFDSREIFSYLGDQNIIPAIKVRRNSIPKSRGCYPRKIAVTEQLTDYRKWAASVSYGRRWIVESVFSSIKRMFGEEVRSKKKRNMIQELMLKISLYNMFVTA